MPQYEYRMEVATTLADFNAMGAHGWKFVGTRGDENLFMRKVARTPRIRKIPDEPECGKRWA